MLRITNQEQDDVPERRNLRKPTTYMCSDCQYESDRLYNVRRHEVRIHVSRKLYHCCGQKFVSKGNYYIHCEVNHPHTRTNTITSRTKYKITSDSVATIPEERINCPYADYGSRSSYKAQFERRYSRRIQLRKRKPIKSEVSLSYSVTYSDVDLENIPLISFLTDRKLKHYLKTLTESQLINNNNKDSEDPTRTLKFAISSQQNIKKAQLENGELNVKDVSDSTVAAISLELPAKKLILQRFRTNVTRKFGTQLWEQNNNDAREVSFAGNRNKGTIPMRQSRAKASERWSDKENVSTFSFSVEQLQIELDTDIALPDVSRVHRDFLGAIDFDKYKIF